MVAVLSPHFDDAVLSCWTIVNEDPRPLIVNVFGGLPATGAALPGWERIKGARDSRERALERAREDREALAPLGCEWVNLDFLDIDYRRGLQDIKPLVTALQERVPPGALLYAPAAIGRHADHFAVRAAAVALRMRGYPMTLYADMPYCMTYGWPHWVTGADRDPYLDVTVDWAGSLEQGEVAVRPEDGDVVRLSEEEQQAKLAVLSRYRTQFSVMRPLVTREGALDYEVFWPLGSASSLTRAQSLRYELMWRAGVRHGSRVESLLRRPALRRLRPGAGSRLGRLLRNRAGGS